MTNDKDAALEAARAAEQQLRKQLASASSSSTAVREAHAEAESLRQQLEESVRKYSTAKQARERAMSEVSQIHGCQCWAAMEGLVYGIITTIITHSSTCARCV